MRTIWSVRTRIRYFLITAALGAAAGVLVLLPMNEFVYFHEHAPIGATSGTAYAVSQLRDALGGNKPRKTAFYAIAGTVLGLIASSLQSALAARAGQVEQLSHALEGDMRLLIASGESASLEFKSSFRWDLKENRTNRSLEVVIMKTIAGYMNGDGGTLLIGVADDGTILGLEPDYLALRRHDRDGFEQALMTAVAAKLGGDACRHVQAIFQTIEQKDICRILVAPAHRPVYVRDGDTPKLYIRAGVSTRELNVQEAIDYTSARWKK